MKSQEIRRKFLDFFKSKNHQIVASAPLVLKNDPSLLFVNAGMNPFKEYFLGNAEPEYNRIADTQKCLRVSGKHNDLEEVGMDTYHHTLFEMLGNWSFGDYFKKEAIEWAWELLVAIYGLNPEDLYVSIFEGSSEDGLSLDTEAMELWSKIVPKERIIMGNKADNFWEMGDQGPCGPCSEIHIDLRTQEEKAQISGRDLVNQDHPQVVEIWNLVFMQYNRKADGSLEKLAAQHIDTGMGFERLCMAMQGVRSNYDTDVFTPLIAKIEAITGSTYDKESLPENADGKVSVAIRVIADHVRAVAFSIADGQLPSNNGAGYVIRRILRRAIRYGFTFLNTEEPFIYKLTSTLAEQMGETFPELITQKTLIENVIKEEEHSFLKTLEKGLIRLDDVINKSENKTLSGEKAFELYDTFGFPIDLTMLILSEKGYQLDHKGFETELQKQKERSRAAQQVATGDWQIIQKDITTDFIGYDALSCETTITQYRRTEHKKHGVQYQIILATTPFYPEGGGQLGDIGYLHSPSGQKVAVLNTKKENNLIFHVTKELPENISGKITAVVNTENRTGATANHTATHLLHEALVSILGNHVEQKGSMVSAKNLRFDFSHFSKVTDEELKKVEHFVNERISESIELIENRNDTIENALEQGAKALFGEKYGKVVRSIRFGNSIELCGGTHVKNTAEIWHFKIKSESAVASGIRRIEAITSKEAKAYFNKQELELLALKNQLKNTKDPLKSVISLQEENSELKKQIEAFSKQKAIQLGEQLSNAFETVNETLFLVQKIDLDSQGVKDLCFELGKNKENAFILIGSTQGEKAILSCYISKELTKNKDLNAGKIVRELGKHIQGGGGGQAFFATAGGKNISGIQNALDAAKTLIESA